MVDSLLSSSVDFIITGLKPQTGVTESFFGENMELSNLRNEVNELQLSRDSLQEEISLKNDKIQKLVRENIVAILFAAVPCM